MSQNKRQQKSTGGGPNKEYKFSALEETIIRICALEESVEGCPDALAFGLSSCSKKRKTDCNPNQIVDSENYPNSSSVSRSVEVLKDKSFDDNVMFAMIMNATEPKEQNIETNDSHHMNSENRTSTPRLTKKPQKGITCDVALEREIEIQQQLCNKVEEAVEAMKRHEKEMEYQSKKICRSIDKISEFQKKMLDETSRHNLEMEAMRMQEIKAKLEFQKRLLEIEEEKLQKL